MSGRTRDLQAFLFRAASTNALVDDLLDSGLLAGPGTGAQSAEHNGVLDQFSFGVRAEALRMARVYELLFCFENSVRELIEERFRETYGPETWAVDGLHENIRKQAEKLRDKEGQVPWHGTRGGSLLAFVDFPVLARIITARWECFEDLLGRPGWVENVFDEMNLSRRAIAHSGVIDQYDLDRMELRVRDWLRVVG